MPDELARMERDLEAFAIRLRALENLETPMQSRAVSELREIQQDIKAIQEHGTLATRGEIARIKDRLDAVTKDVADIEDDVKQKADAAAVKELSDDRKALIRIALAAVVAALLSLGVSLILRATTGGG